MTSVQGRPLKERDLRDILTGLDIAHRKDIHDYSGGHLNESNLAKHPTKTSYKSWDSSKQKSVPKLNLPSEPKSNYHQERMKGTMANFSMGTSGALPTGKKSQVPYRRQGTKGPVKVARGPSAGKYGKADDGVCVEELQPGELMLANSRYSRPKAWVEEDLKDDENYDMSSVSQSLIKDQNLAKMKHVFVPTHLAGITKKDQHAGFRSFEEKVIRKKDATEQHVLTGVKAVEHLENKLQQVRSFLYIDNFLYFG